MVFRNLPSEVFRLEMIPAWPRRGEPTISYKIFVGPRNIVKFDGVRRTSFYSFDPTLTMGELPSEYKTKKLLEDLDAYSQSRQSFGYILDAKLMIFGSENYALVTFGRFFKEPRFYTKAVLLQLGRLRAQALKVYDISFLNHLSDSQALAKEQIESYIWQSLERKIQSMDRPACREILKNDKPNRTTRR